MRNYFGVESDNINKGKFCITVRIVIYRNLHGKYPKFLEQFDTPRAKRDGYSTKFWYIFKDENGNYLENLTKDQAETIANELEEKYKDILKTSEDTGVWDEELFKNLLLIYHK